MGSGAGWPSRLSKPPLPVGTFAHSASSIVPSIVGGVAIRYPGSTGASAAAHGITDPMLSAITAPIRDRRERTEPNARVFHFLVRLATPNGVGFRLYGREGASSARSAFCSRGGAV